jgi:Uma2 family endonuclease
MAVLIRDAGVEARVRSERQASDAARWDEVWAGVLVMPPMPNNEHQRLVLKLCSVFSNLIDWDAGDCCLPGANVSDREADWQFNYRVPDVLVIRAGGRASDRGSHWVGGPDLIVEVISPGEEPYAKLDFYASIGVREVLVLQRDPCLLERFALRNGTLTRTDRCTEAGGEAASEVLPVTFRFKATARLIVENHSTGQIWQI